MLQGQDYERLRWRCIRRGLLELDLILTRFLDEQYPQLNEDHARAFEQLALMEDPTLWDMVSGREACADPMQAEIIGMLRQH